MKNTNNYERAVCWKFLSRSTSLSLYIYIYMWVVLTCFLIGILSQIYIIQLKISLLYRVLACLWFSLFAFFQMGIELATTHVWASTLATTHGWASVLATHTWCPLIAALSASTYVRCLTKSCIMYFLYQFDRHIMDTQPSQTLHTGLPANLISPAIYI